MTHHRIGVLGGSFDPIHHGHLAAASEVAFRLDLDRVVFSPTGLAWLKPAPHVATPEQRFRMTVAATADDPRFSVTRVDVDRAGPTYTADTLRDLQREFGRDHPGDTASWFFITGADALAQILTWKDVDELWDLANIIGVTRPGYALSESGLPGDPVSIQEVTAMAIPPPNYRDRGATREPVASIVPSATALDPPERRTRRTRAPPVGQLARAPGPPPHSP